jgi:hypothetical protein
MTREAVICRRLSWLLPRRRLPPFALIRQFVEILPNRDEKRAGISQQSFINLAKTPLAAIKSDET